MHTAVAICTKIFETKVRQVKGHIINLQNTSEMFGYCHWAWQEQKVELWTLKLDIQSRMTAIKNVQCSSSYACFTYDLTAQKYKEIVELYDRRL